MNEWYDIAVVTYVLTVSEVATYV